MEYRDKEETEPLNKTTTDHDADRSSFGSTISSDTSIALERLHQDGTAVTNDSTKLPAWKRKSSIADQKDFDEEDGFYRPPSEKQTSKRGRRIIWLLGVLCIGGWLLALLLFISKKTYKHSSTIPYDPAATVTPGSGKAVTLDQVLTGQWQPRRRQLSWIAGPDGEDGWLLEQAVPGEDYLVIEDVRKYKANTEAKPSKTLMKGGRFSVDGQEIWASKVWPSKDLKKVLIMSDEQKNWRHSYTGRYWIFDVVSQSAEPLDSQNVDGRIQLASWSPQSDAIVFTRGNNMYLRKTSSKDVLKITTDGGKELFYGVPDWVYEEEVFSGNSATWWSNDGHYIAFLRTNETLVPEYPIQYFASRPSGEVPEPGLEAYPEVRQLKYPKAGAPNPTVDLQFYDVVKDEVFSIPTDSNFPDDDRLITELVWAGSEGKVIVKNTNRISDVLKVAIIDVFARTGKVVRTDNVNELDGGWFEISERTKFVPADPANDRPQSGYIDTIVYQGHDHLAYFTPLDNPEPLMLTSGDWEVVDAPSAIDLNANYVYFVATKESSIERHVYHVNLDGTGMQHYTDAQEGFYEASFSTGAGFVLISYAGPGIPQQFLWSTPSYKGHRWEANVELNDGLAGLAAAHELPIEIYQTVNVDGIELNLVERRPPHFDEKKRYPVVFWLYAGPGSQLVNKKFTVDFQAYMASNLGYIVITLDGRGTGFIGRKARTIVRNNLGHYEALDQITAAKTWAKKSYVDPERIAVWGWSYGGFMALKILELDGGETFKYGMAVAPVTDWRFYDSIYTERYMRTPQLNPNGYESAAITNVTALSKNVRVLIMHGVADDNVHLQNPLTLIDKFDQAGIENYDVHVFPDSDHSITFHGANLIVYHSKCALSAPNRDKMLTGSLELSNWLINAFNGEWLRTAGALPRERIGAGIPER